MAYTDTYLLHKYSFYTTTHTTRDELEHRLTKSVKNTDFSGATRMQYAVPLHIHVHYTPPAAELRGMCISKGIVSREHNIQVQYITVDMYVLHNADCDL